MFECVANDVKLRACPKCLNVTAKNDKCERVRCERCDYLFCFSCSQSQQAIDAHGCHYHRPDCLFYKPYESAAKMENVPLEKCDRCKEKRSACDKPKPLMANGDIPIEEYPEEFRRSALPAAK